MRALSYLCLLAHLIGAHPANAPALAAPADDKGKTIPLGDCEVVVDSGLDGGDCRIELVPLRSRPETSPPRVALLIAPDGHTRLDFGEAPGASVYEIVQRDRRRVLSPNSALDPLKLLKATGWATEPGSGPVFVTLRDIDGRYRSAAFCALDPLDLARVAREHCGVRIAYSDIPEPCIDAVVRERERGKSVTRALLSSCTEETVSISKQLERCRDLSRRRSELSDRLTAMLEGGGPSPNRGAARVDVQRALRRLERLVRRHRNASSRRDKQHELQASLDRLQARLSALETEADKLKTARDARLALKMAAERPGGLKQANLATLLPALTEAHPCVRSHVEVDADGALSLSAIAGDREVLKIARERIGRLEAYLPDFDFSVKLEPGLGCSITLGGRWAIHASSAGLPKRETSLDGDRFGKVLPYPDELTGLTEFAREDPYLAPYFGHDRTPLVWCRERAGIGVCKRDRDEDRWRFRPNPSGRYGAFVIVSSDRAR